MISYILETIVYQILFLGVFQILKSEPYFRVNRLYLLFSLSISLLLPLINLAILLPSTVALPYPEYLQPIQIGESIDQTINSIAPQKNIETRVYEWNPLLIIYITGLIISVCVFIKQNKKMFRLLNLKTSFSYKTKQVVLFEEINNAFSFWNRIYLGDNIPESHREFILEHEYQHLKLRHSLDLILLQTLAFFLWFNPLLYLYRRFLIQVHEFEADGKVIAQTTKPKYINTLLNYKFEAENISFVHSFYKNSNLKQRLKMISNLKHSKPLKYLLIIPICAICILISCTNEEYDKNLVKDENNLEFLKSLALADGEFKKVVNEIREERTFFETKLKTKSSLAEALMAHNININKELSDRDKYKLLFILTPLEDNGNVNKDPNYMLALKKEIEEHSAINAIYNYINEVSEKNKQSYSFETIDYMNYSQFGELQNVPYPEHCKRKKHVELKECVSEYISNHVNSNFDIRKFNYLSSGTYKIDIQFVISRDGYVYNTRAKSQNQELEEEAVRTVETLPKFIPGTYEGEKVAVAYFLPINFTIND